jgi:hypothetical protein
MNRERRISARRAADPTTFGDLPSEEDLMKTTEARSRRAPLLLVSAYAAIVALAPGACFSPVISGSSGTHIGADTLNVPGRPAHGGSDAFQVSRKRVAAKEEPATLVAEDGSRCKVTTDRFKKVRERDYVTCLWRRDDR